MNDSLYLNRVKAMRAFLPADVLAEQHPVLDRASVEDLGAMLYRLLDSDGKDAVNGLVRWAALHTDALMSVLFERVRKTVDTSTHVHPHSRIGVAAVHDVLVALPPLPEHAPPPPPALRPMRVGNEEKRAALQAGGWTCHADIEAQNVPVCWENGGKWVTLEDAYDQLTEVPRAPSLDEMVVELELPPAHAPPPPPPEPYLTVRDLRALLEGLPGDARVVANGAVIRFAEVDRISDVHGVVLLTG